MHPLTYGQLWPGDLPFWAADSKTGWNVTVSAMWMCGPIQFHARPY